MKEKQLDRQTVTVLSPLEEDILTVLWAKNEALVREIYLVLKSKRKLALTSVAVLLDRLYARNIVGRRIETAQGGPRYIYFPQKEKKAFEQEVVASTVDKLIFTFGENALSYFHKRFGKK